MSKKVKIVLLLIPLCVIILFVGSSALAGLPSSAPGLSPIYRLWLLAKVKSTCIGTNKTIEYQGFRQIPVCRETFPDAGTPCSSGDECKSSFCVVSSDQKSFVKQLPKANTATDTHNFFGNETLRAKPDRVVGNCSKTKFFGNGELVINDKLQLSSEMFVD